MVLSIVSRCLNLSIREGTILCVALPRVRSRIGLARRNELRKVSVCISITRLIKHDISLMVGYVALALVRDLPRHAIVIRIVRCKVSTATLRRLGSSCATVSLHYLLL